MHATNRDSSIVYWLGSTIYLNITNRCSNSCYFCLRKFKTGIKEFNLKLEKDPTTEEMIKEIQKVISRNNWSKIVFCGFGEPLERLDLVLELSRWFKRQCWKTIRVDTNGQGYLLNADRDVARELREAGVKKVRISLNAHNKETYNQICNPKFDDAFENVLKFITSTKEEGIETEVTAITIPEVEITKVKDLAERMGVKFTVRQYISLIW